MSNSGKTKKKRCRKGLHQCKEIGNDCYPIEFINDCKTRKKNKEIKHLKECLEITQKSEEMETQKYINAEYLKNKNLADTNTLFTSEEIRNITRKECKEKLENYDLQIKEIKTLRNSVKENCDKVLFSKKYNIENGSLLDLLKLVKDIDTYETLIELFPETGTKLKVTKPHVFESLWKLVFLLNIDDFYSNYKRKFYTKLENPQHKNVYDFLNDTKINSGNESGIADLYFEIENNNENKNVEQQYACMDKFVKNVPYKILFTSKYYKTEKSATNYDIREISYEAFMQGMLPEQLKAVSNGFKIIALVNNKDEFINKLRRKSDKMVNKHLSENCVYGSIDFTVKGKNFYNKLKELIKNVDLTNENSVKELVRQKLNLTNEIQTLQLRFHQLYFVEYTNQKIEENHENNKFIWGAVARSGKSYMIGGLILKRKPKNVILLLGAIGETKTQFIDDLFKKYSEFNHYRVEDVQGKSIKNAESPEAGKILVLSQEKSKMDLKKELTEKLDKMLESELPIVFFDEIHQGIGNGLETKQTNLIKYIKNKNPNAILVMVTATYGKPEQQYGKLLDNKDIIMVKWSYDMIMKMKNFSFSMLDLNNEASLIHATEDDSITKIKILNECVQTIIGKQERNKDSELFIAKPYLQFPVLNYLIPIAKEIDFKDGKRTFSKKEDFRELLCVKNGQLDCKTDFDNFLSKYIYDSVYNELLYGRFGFNVQNIHSQIWFMPTRPMCNRSKIGETFDDDDENNEGGYFGELCTAVAERIVNVQKFDNFNICIVHGVNEAKSSNYNNNENYKLRIFYECINNKNVKNCIKDHEEKSKMEGKSLIIMTGKKLRLGVSLPCVDVAIHMDPIKSYDVLYQSMFRVLTERPEKKAGYFVDMILDRAVEFVFNFAIEEKKAIHKFNSYIEQQDILRVLNQFNVTMISSNYEFKNNNEVINGYSKMLEVFGLNNKDVFENLKQHHYGNVSIKDVKNILWELDKNTLTQLIKNLKIIGEKQTNLKKKASEHLTNARKENSLKPKKQTNKEIILQDGLITGEQITSLAKHIENALACLILFNDNAKSLKDLINDLNNFDSIDENKIEKIKNCEDDDNVFYCYLLIQYLYGYENEVEEEFQNTDNGEDMEGGQKNKKQNVFEKFKNLKNTEIISIIKYSTFLLQVFLKFDYEGSVLNNLFYNIKEKFSKMKKNQFSSVPEQKNIEETPSFCPENFMKNTKVLDKIREHLTPKEKEKNLFGEVFTPISLVCEMLSRLPEDVWTNPNLKWLDPTNGIGNFPIVVYYKLMETLAASIKEDKKRSKHIIENMLYMNELNPVNVAISKRIFKWIDPDAHPNIRKGDFLTMENINGVEKFDIIVGNPPFNAAIQLNNVRKSIYPLFVMESVKKLNSNSGKLIFIIPSRWFSGGSSYDEFRTFMTSRTDIVFIKHFSKSETIWPDIDLKGGVNYFLIDFKTNSNFTKFIIDNKMTKLKLNKYDIVLKDADAYELVDKILKNNKNSIDSIYFPPGYYGISTNDSRLENSNDTTKIKCFVSKRKGDFKFIKKTFIKKDYNYWKVFTPEGAGKGGDGFGNIFIGTPNEIASQTFVSFKVENEEQANSLKSYLETDIINYLLSLRKIDQHVGETQLKWIPLVPFDRIWTNEKVCKHLNISNCEFYVNKFKSINNNQQNKSGGKKYTQKTNRKIQNRSRKLTSKQTNKKTRKTH